MRAFSPVARRMPSRRTGLNPTARYRGGTRPVPGWPRCTRHRQWRPTTRCRFVRVSVTVIVAPGTAAPAWSFTSPVISPAAVCARAGVTAAPQTHATVRQAETDTFVTPHRPNPLELHSFRPLTTHPYRPVSIGMVESGHTNRLRHISRRFASMLNNEVSDSNNQIKTTEGHEVAQRPKPKTAVPRSGGPRASCGARDLFAVRKAVRATQGMSVASGGWTASTSIETDLISACTRIPVAIPTVRSRLA